MIVYKRYNQGWLKHIDFILWDAFALQLAFILAYAIRQRGLPYGSALYRSLAIFLVVVDILFAAIFNTMHNVMKRGYYSEAIQTLKQVLLILAVTSLYLFSMQIGDAYSRITIFLTAAFHFILGYGIRLLWKQAVRKIAQSSRKASMILVADEKQVPEIFARINSTDDVQYSGIVFSNRDGSGESVAGVPVVASLETAADYICREWVDEVFVYPATLTDMEVHRSNLYKSVEGFINDTYDEFIKKDYDAVKDEENDEMTVAALIEACRQMAVPVHIRLPLSNIGEKSFIEKVGGYNVLTTVVNYASPLQLAVKRMIDIAGGLIGSVIALVVIAVVGPKIKK